MASSAKKVLAEGDKLDDFPCYTHKLASDTGASIALSDFKGKQPVVCVPWSVVRGCGLGIVVAAAPQRTRALPPLRRAARSSLWSEPLNHSEPLHHRLFFYPAASTYGCTKQACAFRDNYAGFKELDCAILGISSDAVSSQEKFSKAHSFPFPLLADTEKVYRTGLGVSGDLFGLLPGRRTIVVDKEGKCVLNYGSATAFEEHSKRALEAVKAAAK